MGMSASQTRVLMLTARQNDLEFQAQQILQAKLAASRQAEDAAAAYEEKISNTHFVTSEYQDGKEVKKSVTANDVYSNNCYFVNRNGQIVIPSDDNDEILEMIRSNPKAYGVNRVRVGNEGSSTYYTVVEDSRLDSDVSRADGTDAYYKEMLEKGELTLCRVKTVEEDQDIVEHKYTTMDATAAFAEVYYTADDAEAEAKYNSISKKLETLEKKLDMQMEQIETERSAVKTEKESVEKVVKENVEKTFNTFG